MTKKEITGTKNKMALVAAVATKWPDIGRNQVLSFTMDSLREALINRDPAALAAPDKGEVACVVSGCTASRGRGLAVCATHRHAYLKGAKL